MKRSFSRSIVTGSFARTRRPLGPSSACATTGSARRSVLAVAGIDSDRVDALLKRLLADCIVTSIYRARLLTLSYETGTRDELGDVEKPERLRVSFAVAEPVSRREFVVDQELYKLLWRNVVDLHERRQVLKTHGVPIRRGVLLYGPPGTGKTFACRYLCGQLPDTTRIVVAGSALNRIGQLCSTSPVPINRRW